MLNISNHFRKCVAFVTDPKKVPIDYDPLIRIIKAEISNCGCRTYFGGGTMDIFDKLRRGDAVNMMSEEYQPVIWELHRADAALFRVNHAVPRSAEQKEALIDLFMGDYPNGLSLFTPVQIDFPKQMRFGQHVFISHSFTAMSIGGIDIDDNVQIGPHVTVVTDNHDFANRYILKCKPVHISKNAWIGANVTILPGVTVGENAVVAAGAVVTKDVPAHAIVGGNPAKVLRFLKEASE